GHDALYSRFGADRLRNKARLSSEIVRVRSSAFMSARAHELPRTRRTKNRLTPCLSAFVLSVLQVPQLHSGKTARNERRPPRDSSPEVMNFALRSLRVQGAKSAELPQGQMHRQEAKRPAGTRSNRPGRPFNRCLAPYWQK